MDKLGNNVHQNFPPEDDNGEVEYKWSLINIKTYKFQKLVSQMRWRVQEASENNSALYVIGVHDNGQLTGLPRKDFITTFIQLLDCANVINFYVCIKLLKKLPNSERYWAVIQVFDSSKSNQVWGKYHTDEKLPTPPNHALPDYLKF